MLTMMVCAIILQIGVREKGLAEATDIVVEKARVLETGSDGSSSLKSRRSGLLELTDLRYL